MKPIPLFESSGELLSPKIDFVFKLLFGTEQNKDLLVAFLKAVLDLPHEEYGDIMLRNTFLPKTRKTDKFGVLDVLLKTTSGALINIEIQVLPFPDYDARLLFYLGKLLSSQITEGESYTAINKTISISVLNFEFIHDTIEYKNVYRLHDPKTKSTLTGLLEVITLELPKLPKNGDTNPVFPWLQFIGSKNKEETMLVAEKYPELHEAYERLQILSLDENNRAEYELRLKWYLDEVSLLHARDTAEEKGFHRGLERGHSEGAAQAKLETARKMKRKGLSADDIAEYTGLSAGQIEAL